MSQQHEQVSDMQMFQSGEIHKKWNKKDGHGPWVFQLFDKSDIISLIPQNTEQFDGFFNADNVVQGQKSSLWV